MFDKLLNESKDYYENNYVDEETSVRIQEQVLKRIRRKERMHKKKSKLMYFTYAAATVIVILIGTSFTSSTVSNALAQLPFLNSIYEENSDAGLVTDVKKELKPTYNIDRITIDYSTKTMNIGVLGEQNYLNKVKDSIQQSVREILDRKGLDAYSINVYHDKGKTTTTRAKLNQTDETKSMESTIKQQISNHYKIGKVVLFPQEKILSLGVKGDSSYYYGVSQSLKKNITKILNENGLSNYKPEIFHQIKGTNMDFILEDTWESLQKVQRQSLIIQNNVEHELARKGYKIYSVQARPNPKEKFMSIEVLPSELRHKEIKESAIRILEKMNFKGFTVKTYKADYLLSPGWTKVFTSINQGLIGVKKYKVNNVGFSTSPLTLSVNTSLSSSNPDANKLAEEIKSTVKQFVQSDEVKENIQEDDYIINIYSEDGKRIN
ncbi:DUF4030 domain-containing protein [Halobacillus rhizosphaerae]|uniref:DUF4030 domain-containing protein n=1 Tax=Halobacillus rhizosphaerae TaxID=3064889 RepID=UPI00398AB52B